MRNLFSSKTARRVPEIPRDLRIYAIGDVHGRADLLTALLPKIDVDIARRPVLRPIIVFLGDYIDRGQNSREVIDLLLAWEARREIVFLKGNHEDLLIRFLEDPDVLEEWRYCGGLTTLLAYGLRPLLNPSASQRVELADELSTVLPKSHRDFFLRLKPSLTCGDFFFVHAGVRPLVPLSEQIHQDLIWIRDEFLSWEEPFEKVIVHGHTPVPEPVIMPHRINIDTGAFATGRLTCMVFEGSQIALLPE